MTAKWRNPKAACANFKTTMPTSDIPPDRKTFRVRVAQAWKVVLALVLPPLLILPGIWLLAQFRGLPESVVAGVITVMVVSVCGAAIWLVFRSIPHVDYSVEGERHQVEVLRPTLLSVRSFDFGIGEVTGFRVGESKGRLYFTLTMSGYPGKFSINADSDREKDVEQFRELLLLVAERLDERKAVTGA